MASKRTPAILIHPSDNVATALQLIPAGTRISLRKNGKTTGMVVQEEIPVGHKVSLLRIKRGEKVIKYGETIGLASANIEEGSHVHIHNLESQRGRGDLKAKRGV